MSANVTSDCPASLPNDLRSILRDVMRQTPYLALRSVEIELHEDVVILSGRLPSFFLKQVAQQSVGRTLISHRIVNNIEVPATDSV